MVGSKPKINDNIYDMTPGIQKRLTDTSNNPLKKLNDKDNEIIINISESFDFESCQTIRGESKSSRY